MATTIGTTCTNHTGDSVTIDAPSSGVVMVEADAIIRIEHYNGTQDEARIHIGENDADCSASNVNSAWVHVPAGASTDETYHSVHLTKSFPVSAGTKTFYLNGYMSFGQSTNDKFFYANMKAVYYPY
jgi:hypothetical protein